jgi:predicted ester cyclase
LWFGCTPEREFAGIPPTGRRVEFAEHVSYRFRDGRIERVWSLIDTDAVRDQMGSGARGASSDPVDPA